MVPRGLEPRTLRLLAVRFNQLIYKTVGEKGSEFTLMLKTVSCQYPSLSESQAQCLSKMS